MTIIDFREKMRKKYGPVDEIKPTVEKILKENWNGLDYDQILGKLKSYKGIREDLRVLLRSGYFEIYEGGKKTIYKIRIKDS